MLKRKLVRLVSGTVVTSMLFSTIIQAKPKVPTGTTMIMADTYLEDTAPKNVYNLTQQMVERGFSGTDLDVLYVQQTGGSNRAYHNLNKFYDVDHPLPGNETATLWDDVKYKFDASANNGRGAIVPIDDVSNIATTTIQVRSGFTSFVKLENNILKLSDEATFGELKKMIEATDKSTQRYTAKLGDKEITDVDKLETGNTYNLIVTAEDGEAVDSSTYTIEVSKSGGSVELPAPKFTKNLTIKGETTTENPVKECNVGDPDITLEVKAELEGNKEAEISYEWYSIGEKQDIPSQDLLQYYNLPEANLVGTGESFTFTPSKVGTTYYFATAIYKEGDSTSRTQSNLATITVKEGELTKDEFSVGDYVYNNQSDSTDTMGMIEGTALKNTEITIEANFSKLATTTAGDDGEWKATFPRQNAGTVIKVTATLGGKSFTKDITVKTADDNDIRAFRESVDLNDLIEKRDNLYWSDDGGNTGIKAADLKKEDNTAKTPVPLKSGDYWIDNKDSVEAFKAYVDLIEKVLDYKYQISDVDLKYMQTIAKPTVDILNKILNKVDGNKETTSELTLSVGGNKQGTVTIKDKDAGAIVGAVSNEVYTINNGKTVTITATPNASNAVAGWLIDGKPSVETNKTIRELSITKATSVQAIFAPTEDASKVEDVIKKVEEITANGTKPFEVSISETAPSEDKIKATVEAAIKEILPEGAEVKGVVLEEIPTRATTKNYKATVTFKVGDIEFTITIEISVKVDSSITNVTASVEKTAYDNTNKGTKIDLNLDPYVEGITKTDITLTDGEGKEAEVASVTEAGTGETKYYEVLAKLTKDVEYTIKVTKDGYDIATTTVKGLDVDSPTPDEKGDFVQIKSFVIANDAEVATSVEQIVYQKTVGESASQAVYKIYAKLSNPVANFSVGDTSVKFNLDLSATVTKNNVTTDYPDLLNGLRFNNVTRVLMKELSEDNSKLEITLDLDGVGESEDKATTHTINFKWVEPNKADVTGDPLKALKFKAYKFKK